MTPVIQTVGKTIRELIEKERTPDLPHPSLTPKIKKKILKKEKEPTFKYMDKKGIFFDVGTEYHGYKVEKIVMCTFVKNKQQSSLKAQVGDFFPVDIYNRIIKSSGERTGLAWNGFVNRYKFKLHNEGTPVINDKTMEELIYNTNREKELMKANCKRLTIEFYEGVILETVMHIKTEKDMTVIEDQENLEKELRNSRYWSKFKNTVNNLEDYYVNRNLNITIWKYNTVWIITSNSSYSRIRKYLSEK